MHDKIINEVIIWVSIAIRVAGKLFKLLKYSQLLNLIVNFMMFFETQGWLISNCVFNNFH